MRVIDITMAKIKEDYCSQEVYRLLLEKGFDDEIHTTFDREGYTQPSITLQMAMKWLREVHNFHILVEPNHDKKGLYNVHVKVGWWSNNWAGVGYNTYEVACEAAIKYCLENLI